MATLEPAFHAPVVSPQLQQLAGLICGKLPMHWLTDLSPADSEALCHVAVQQGVAPLLYQQLQDAGLLPALTRPGYAALLAAYGQTAGYNFLAQEAAKTWTAHLDGAGITGIWLKGLPLSLTVYPSPDTRPMVDIDVLVSPADREAALNLAETVTGSQPVMLQPDQAIHAIFEVGEGNRVKMELHWSLIAPPTSDMAPNLDWFLNDVIMLETDQGPFCTLAPEAHLLYLCAHAQLGHGESQFMLVRYLDMHLLINSYAALDWDLLVARAVDCRWTYAVERALRWVQHFFGTAIPEEVPALLAASRPDDENISLVEQRGEPGTRWDRLQVRMQGEHGAGRLRLVLAMLFPPPAYIRWRYQVAGWKVPFYYPYRWFDGLREVTRSK